MDSFYGSQYQRRRNETGQQKQEKIAIIWLRWQSDKFRNRDILK